MPNMSYCRFRNTLKDLRDCWENWDELNESQDTEEAEARHQIIKLCKEIVEGCGA